ncbi:unnamed protein product [Phytophthora fragariaefolia]|uniref:Unnamed protein product n=1 Tax=Phytophthora fragariaefolia TaxID=1490495 RepID=A0A9W7CX05_9STRA|nr:unnamed protein product [Phytophthora fragariaefolia]
MLNQVRGASAQTLRRVSSSTRLKRSVLPSVWGWSAADMLNFVPNTRNSGKPRVTVGDNRLQRTVMSEDTVHEERRGLFARDCVEDRSKKHHLAQTAYKHQDPGVAVVIGRKSEEKSRLIDFQQTNGTVRLCNGADAWSKGLTR